MRRFRLRVKLTQTVMEFQTLWINVRAHRLAQLSMLKDAALTSSLHAVAQLPAERGKTMASTFRPSRRLPKRSWRKV